MLPEPDPTPTTLLLIRHHQGSADALRQLLQRELPSIREQAHRMLGGVVRQNLDTGDVVQEVCLHVLRTGPRFSVAGSEEFRRLMARIVRNKLVSLARHYNASKRSGEPPAQGDTVLYLEAEAPRVANPTPSEHAVRNEERELVRLGLDLIDPLDREILTLRDEFDLSYVEIGARLDGMQEDAVRMRYKRGLKKLELCVQQLRRQRLQPLLDELDQADRG